MGESACLMPAFSYTSGLSTEDNKGNPMHALGESISFGRFMTESLSWEKWSTFSHKSYVEEAERYAQPGSVAQKKAFFEAHYKRIAAKKAAALLEQQANDTPKQDFEVEVEVDVEVGDISIPQSSQPTNMNSQVVLDENPVVEAPKPEAIFIANLMNDEAVNQLENVGNNNVISESELSGSPQMEKPLLERNLNSDDHEVSSLMSKRKQPARSSYKSSKIPSSPAKPKALIHAKKENNVTPITRNTRKDLLDRKRSTPKSLHALISSTPREPDKFGTPAVRRIESSKVAPSSLKASKDCATPLRTPTMATMSGVPMHHPSATPTSESRRARTPVDPKASLSKTTGGPKWHILSAVCSKSLSACRRKLQSPSLATPFCLRTEERAARRKQKLEEKFNAKEEQKVQLQTKLKEKAETEVRKLRQSLCFKARPLPEFYKEKETPKNMIKKTSVTHPQSHKLGTKANSTTMQGLTSLPPQTPSIKSKGSKHVFKKHN